MSIFNQYIPPILPGGWPHPHSNSVTYSQALAYTHNFPCHGPQVYVIEILDCPLCIFNLRTRKTDPTVRVSRLLSYVNTYLQIIKLIITSGKSISVEIIAITAYLDSNIMLVHTHTYTHSDGFRCFRRNALIGSWADLVILFSVRHKFVI